MTRSKAELALDHDWFRWRKPIRILLMVVAGICSIGLLASLEPTTAQRPFPKFVLDPNTAPPEALLALPKLGPAMVARIVEAREVRPFRSLEDLDQRVRGIGPATIASLRPYLKITNQPINDRRAGPDKVP